MHPNRLTELQISYILAIQNEFTLEMSALALQQLLSPATSHHIQYQGKYREYRKTKGLGQLTA